TGRVPPEVVSGEPVGGFAVRDLLTGARYDWGEHNYIRLIPDVQPAHILRVERSYP
ncbi:MAG: hypothetical protein GWO16_00700, partial [Gammaproteobacteria bacterium]|nr:hypothetical protein [Gammaproteobacteria bacterium]NIR96636.1 hypothetical protein [Gammaproteobacteria bacterium]NIU52049.1 hypothetical protein [Gemmatimonadota bacterium]NIW35941.1 hypothetical protein [Gemmatimonadota bacterium]NIY42316.1 hypothetical protein [Gemmatimonadota bacterium]